MPYSNDDPAPAGVIRAWWEWFPVWTLILAVVLVVGGLVTWGGSEFGWWLNGQAANHNAVNTQNGYANQTTLRGELTNDLATVATITVQITQAGNDPSAVAALKPQRAAIADKACSEAAEITDGLPEQQAQWNAANCSGGSLSPSSDLYQSGQP